MRGLALALVLPLVLGAADETEQAKQYFEAGRQAYDAGQYAAAATAFEEALRRAEKPAILFSAAQAYRLQYFVDRDARKLKKAIGMYRQYLDQVGSGGRRADAIEFLAQLEPLARVGDDGRGEPELAKTQLMVSSRTPGARVSLDDGAPGEAPLIAEVPPGKHAIRVEAEGFFPETVTGVAVDRRLVVVEVNLRPRPAQLVVDGPSGASVTIDGRLVGVTPLEPIPLGAGPHYVTISSRGRYPRSEELRLERGQSIELDVELEPTVQRYIAIGFLAGAGALLAAGGAVGTFAYLTDQDAVAIDERLLGGRGLSPDDVVEYNRLADRRDELRTTAAFLAGGALVSGVTGLLLFLVDNPRVEARRPGLDDPSLTPAVSGDGFGARLEMHF